MRNFIREIHRRSLWQVLGIYLAGGWIALQVVEQLAEAAGLPPWVRPFALILLIIGLPLVLATAFLQEGMTTRRPPVRDSADDAEEGTRPGSAEPVGAAKLLTWRNVLMGGGAALAVWGLISAGWIFFGMPGASDAEPAGADAADAPAAGTGAPGTSLAPEYLASVAVMPFENLADPEDDHIAEGFNEEVTTKLARIERLKVISPTSVEAIRDANLSLPQIGDTLDVEHVLRGSVREAGDQLRVTVELMLAATDAIVWAEAYTRAKENIFELQDDIAERVSLALVENVAGLTRRTSARTVNSDAYEAYLRGRRAIHARTGEAFGAAIAAFREAIEADSMYAPAYAGLASALGLSLTYTFDMQLSPYERFREALALASRAIELDPEHAQAYGARSYVEVKARAPVEVPLADVERAVALLPNSADMRGWYAHSLSRAGRHEDAMAQARTAIELDPIAPGRRVGLSIDAFAAREYQVALDEARSALVLQPALIPPRVTSAYALLMLRRPAECLELDLPETSLARAACLYEAGDEEAAEEIASGASGPARESGSSALSDVERADLAEGLSIYFAWIGDADASLEWHDLAFSLSPDGVDFRLYTGGLFERVRSVGDYEERVAAIWDRAWARVSEGVS